MKIKFVKYRRFNTLDYITRSLMVIFLSSVSTFSTASASEKLTTSEVKEIAKQAYIFGYPIVDNYRVQYSYFVNTNDKNYKGDWNKLHNVARVYTPQDTSIQTPNSDTPYSYIGADLRSEPLVLTVPKIEKGRYYSIQFVDMYTHNIAYVGSRTTGNEAANFMLVGPDWKGNIPKGIKKVIRSETEFVFIQYRTQLFNNQDLNNVKNIQDKYSVQTLSKFMKTSPPPNAPKINFIKALTPEQQKTSPSFFNVLNFTLQFAPVHKSEIKLRESFKKIGIEPGTEFNFASLPKDTQEGIEQGIKEAWMELQFRKTNDVDTGKVSAADGYGTREFMQGRYLDRMISAVYGIYGNTKEEALYPAYFVDSKGNALKGSNKYELTFPAGQLPPAKSFWSLTMYKAPEMYLYDNTIDRYLINSNMLNQLVKNKDGSITIYIQDEQPKGKEKANWLPAPSGSFVTIMRLYWPEKTALNGTWKQPKLIKVN